MKDVSPNSSIIKVEGDFEGFTPQELFDHWTNPQLLVKWWPREATVDPKVGGYYRFTWPQQNWTLHGHYTAFEPAAKLGFTWAWNMDINAATPLQVEITFTSGEHGSHMVITHGPWDQSEAGQTERQGVLEGWIHFGMRLAGLRRGLAT